jgi:hypothetical protein
MYELLPNYVQPNVPRQIASTVLQPYLDIRDRLLLQGALTLGSCPETPANTKMPFLNLQTLIKKSRFLRFFLRLAGLSGSRMTGSKSRKLSAE